MQYLGLNAHICSIYRTVVRFINVTKPPKTQRIFAPTDVDKAICVWYNNRALLPGHQRQHFGGIAQLARAIGSYPIGRRFKSDFRYHHGPLVKRLRHRPFTAVTGVRLSHGSPQGAGLLLLIFICGVAFCLIISLLKRPKQTGVLYVPFYCRKL